MKKESLKTKKVLTIEDSLLTQNLIKRALGMFPEIEVLTASSGEEGIKLLKKNTDIDLILIDITMPKYDGVCVLRYLNKYFSNREFKVCMLTGRNSMKDINQCLENGCDDYILKPFDIERFRHKVLFHLGENDSPEINTTFIKKTDFEAQVLDIPIELIVNIKSITEYNLYFESNYEFRLNSTIKLQTKVKDNYFFGPEIIELMVKSVERITSSKYRVTTRFISLNKQEENKLRAYIIAKN
jgi:CheY-like chemotaxis protein